MKRFPTAAAASLLCVGAANAAVTSIPILDGSGATQHGAFSLDAGTLIYPLAGLCGGAAAAPGTTIAQCAIVNSSGQLLVTGPVTNAGTFAVQLNVTPTLANGNGIVPTQGGAVLSATNGEFANILQGNAVLSATNGLFANLLQGNAVLSTSNALFGKITDGATVAGVDATSTGLKASIVACAPGICGLPTVTGNALVQGRISTAMTGTTPTSLIAAVTSQRIYVTSVSCKNTSANNTLVNITDGSGGTVLAQLAAGATYGGDNIGGGSVPLFWTTAGNALFAVNVTTSASTTCNASGYSSAS